ncbi:MAG TPA: alpha-L-fucosidase [Fimbriimonadaceae bacterium]|nr:alpha-L-fucosidase [Fimbriimonadaceae bacterium]
MFLTLAACGLLALFVAPPEPFGALPSHRQAEHAKLETYAFLHFTVNTFTDREWGHGDEDPNVFDPDQFDPDQIVLALKAGGMKGAILTCKHHDGFCLWPSKTTDHTIAQSKWKNGKGDVVRAIADACRRHGLRFGVYLSPWDRNNAHYGKPEYVSTYRQQLHELLSQYGPIFEVWHDGANGGDGYYGGARETRSIDRRTYYGWPETWEMVRKLQPDACIFSDVGPDLRWVGNESGYAAETSWQTYDPIGEKDDQPAPGYVKSAQGEAGTRHGKNWLPAECDVSIRPGWFWHASEDGKVKSLAALLDLYYRSVGRGASFLLNVPPNRHGRISDPDVANLKAFGDVVRETFAHNLAAGARVSASNVRGGISANALLSGDDRRYYTSDDSALTPTIELDLRGQKTFDVIRLREAIRLGQRVERLAVDVSKDGSWQEVGGATSVGSCRLIRLPHPVTSDKVRIRILASAACPVLYDFGLFKQPGR